MTDYQQLLKAQILNESLFVEASFTGARKGAAPPWERVEVRPVQLSDGRFLQFSYFVENKHIAKNYAGHAVEAKLNELLSAPFKSMQVTTVNGRTRVQFTKKGKAILHEEKAKKSIPLPSLAHDRQKTQLLQDDQPLPFLQAVNIMTQDGRIRAGMHRKFRQINQFLQIVDDTLQLDDLPSPLRVADFGCGNAYLTFAFFHYLMHIKQRPTALEGIDLKAELMARHNQTAQALGWEAVRFHPMRIADYAPDAPLHMVLALHACDTATDEALAQGIALGADYIFSAPCCHHHLQAQLDAAPVPFAPVFDHGILKERLGDILTDTLRAQILRMLGYRTDVIEFIATEHTPKNLMIRAVRDGQPDAVAQEAYTALKTFWRVTPFLETLLRQRDLWPETAVSPT